MEREGGRSGRGEVLIDGPGRGGGRWHTENTRRTTRPTVLATTSVLRRALPVVFFIFFATLQSTFPAVSTTSPTPLAEQCFKRTISPHTVSIKYGSLRGLIVHPSPPPHAPTSPRPRLPPVEAFLGVPYASPPTGALRFMPPVTPGHWRGTRLATRLAPSCPQPPPLPPANTTTPYLEWLNRLAARTEHSTEDCLYLNIYTPVVDLEAISRGQRGVGEEDAEKDADDQDNDTTGDNRENEMVADEGEEGWGRRERKKGNARHRRHRVPRSPGTPSVSSSSFATRRSSAARPVLVLLSAPSYASSLGPLLDGSLLASYGQALVVTLNHRLGVLGFLPASVDGVVRGNHALLDIVAGLHWLQQNVEAFGGQPANVTLIGHGHGAALAHILALSPMAKGLFSRVVLLSGSALAPWAIARDAASYAQKLASQLGCPTEPAASLVECLRSASVSSLLSASFAVPEHMSAFGPSLDAIVMPLEPRVALRAALARGEGARETIRLRPNATHHRLHPHWPQATSQPSPSAFTWPDLLIGLTRVEVKAVFSAEEEEVGLSLVRRDRILRTLVRNSFDYHQQAIFHTLVNEYTDWARPVESATARLDSLVELLGDADVVAGSTEAADHVAALGALTRASQGPAKTTSHAPRTFFYVFEHTSPSPSPRYYSRLGAPPGTDLAYLLGLPLLTASPSGSTCATSSPPRYPTLELAPGQSPGNFSDAEVTLAKQFIRYLANFAADGDPNGSPLGPTPPASSPFGQYLRRLSLAHFETVHSWPFSSSSSSVHWPQYDTGSKKYMRFGSPLRLGDHYRSHPLSIWLSLIPRLTMPSEIEERDRKEGKGEDDAGRHHLLPDHGNEASYKGLLRGETGPGQTRANLSEPLDWAQAMLFGRAMRPRLRLAGDRAVPTPVPGNEQFAGRRAEEEKRAEERANAASKDQNEGAKAEDGREEEDLVHLTRPDAESSEDAEPSNYSTALMVTIVVGCSLLLLNVVVFLGVYCQVEGRRRAEDEAARAGTGLLEEDNGHQHSPKAAASSAASKPSPGHSQLLITSRSHKHSSVSYAVVSEGADGPGAEQRYCATLPHRRTRELDQGPAGQTSTLRRSREHPPGQYQLVGEAGEALYLVHCPPPSSTPLKSILKTTPAEPSQPDYSLHYLPPLPSTEYLDGGNFLTFLPPPLEATPPTPH